MHPVFSMHELQRHQATQTTPDCPVRAKTTEAAHTPVPTSSSPHSWCSKLRQTRSSFPPSPHPKPQCSKVLRGAAVDTRANTFHTEGLLIYQLSATTDYQVLTIDYQYSLLSIACWLLTTSWLLTTRAIGFRFMTCARVVHDSARLIMWHLYCAIGWIKIHRLPGVTCVLLVPFLLLQRKGWECCIRVSRRKSPNPS